MSMFLFLLFSVLLVCPFFRLKELFQEKNGLTTSLLFFLENAKNLGRSDDAKQRKKRGWPKGTLICGLVGNNTGRGEAKTAKTTEFLLTFGPRMWSY